MFSLSATQVLLNSSQLSSHAPLYLKCIPLIFYRNHRHLCQSLHLANFPYHLVLHLTIIKNLPARGGKRQSHRKLIVSFNHPSIHRPNCDTLLIHLLQPTPDQTINQYGIIPLLPTITLKRPEQLKLKPVL